VWLRSCATHPILQTWHHLIFTYSDLKDSLRGQVFQSDEVVIQAINEWIEEQEQRFFLFSPVQSAYGKHHSTETALVKIPNDLVTTIDQGHVGALALLDLSSAFDTTDHQLLLNILHQRFCITDSALSWFNSISQITLMSSMLKTKYPESSA
jgi:hypothetical protein